MTDTTNLTSRRLLDAGATASLTGLGSGGGFPAWSDKPEKTEVKVGFIPLTGGDPLKIVIIGQDPYHGPNQANGLSFSVNDGVTSPPSLVNIFKELKEDCGCEIPSSGNLENWAKQGVFLLNATLTVRQFTAGSHQKKGWEQFTDAAIKMLSDKRENLVFLLWGNYAREKSMLIDSQKHLVLQAAHPSPLARGAFFGSRHFSKANQYLEQKGKQPINWCL